MQGMMRGSMPNQLEAELGEWAEACRKSGEATPRANFRGVLMLLALLLVSAGCVTQGDFLSLREEVSRNHRADRNAPDPFARIAALSADVDVLRQQIRDLQGELELARKEAADALLEVRRTRSALAQGPVGPGTAAGAEGAVASGGDGAPGGVAALGAGSQETTPSPDEELARYQGALDSWRKDDYNSCIDLFTTFLQSYPTSGYADDAAYWLADCTYKNDEFKRAVVRFNAVVSVYPESPKAPDALYRQGESLLKLGPKFHQAAKTVFERVQKDYPNSERAAEAARQLERLGTG